MQLTLLRLPVSDTRLHCVRVVHSSNSTMPDLMPWWDPWNASQLMTDVPPEPLPASRAQTLNPVLETDFTHSAAGSWTVMCLLPWLRATKTLTSLEPWNWVLKETDWQPWLFWDVSVMLTFPAWKTIAKKGEISLEAVLVDNRRKMTDFRLKLRRPRYRLYQCISVMNIGVRISSNFSLSSAIICRDSIVA